MAVRHLFDTYLFNTHQFRLAPGQFRASLEWLAHLLGMTSETSLPSDFQPIVSISELAAYLGVPIQTIYDSRHQGRGPHGFRIGRELKFRASEVEAWLRHLEENDHRQTRNERR
jgi:excisionase family DNA binding protein